MSKNVLQRPWWELCREGARPFWFKLLRAICYHRLFPLERSLTKPIPDIPPALPVTMDWLAEVTDYSSLQATAGAPRRNCNQRCLRARVHGRLVGRMWVATSRAWLGGLKHELPLGPDAAYLFDAYTDPSFRGQAIAPAISAELLRRLREEGCRRAIRVTLPENKAALHAHAKAGFRKCAIIRRFRLGPWQVVWQRPLRDLPLGGC